MAQKYRARVYEFWNGSGLGLTIALAGKPDGSWQTFSSVFADTETTDVVIYSATLGQFESCSVTYNASGNTLTRGAIKESSNAGARVDFGTGPKTVLCMIPAKRIETLFANLTELFKVLGPTALRSYTFPDANDTVATLSVSQTFSASKSFSQTGVGSAAPCVVTGSTPAYGWSFGAGGADQKNWDAVAGSTVLNFRSVNDANNSVVNWCTVNRGTGTAITSVSIPNLAGLTTAMFAANVADTDGTLVANSDTRFATQKATKTYVDQIVAAQDAMVFKGVIDCSANPNYPAADRGHTYRVSVAGKIGGASGPNVEVGDILICLTDSTASGNQATVGASWGIIQVNIDGAVISTRSISTTAPLAGGGDLSANRTLSLDVLGLATDSTPDSVADYLLTYDASASAYKKSLIASVVGAAAAGVTSVNGQTGALVGWTAPQGRLTLTSATPVTTSDVVGATSHFFTPYAGNLTVTYDGTNFIPAVFAEYTQTAADATKSPYAMPANAIVDVWGWNDSGTKRFTRGDYWANKGTATVTIATPAVVSFTAHGGVAGSPVRFTTTGALPTGITAGTIYYLIAAGLTANAFEIAATVGGAAINTTGSQSGVHTAYVASDTTPGTGTGTSERDSTTALPTNKNAVTNGPAANRGVLVGSLRSNSSGQYNDSAAFRWVSNAYYPRLRPMRVVDATLTWPYTLSAFRQANGSAANQLDWLQTLSGGQVTAQVNSTYTNSSAASASVGIDIDTLSTTAIVNNTNNTAASGAGTINSLAAQYNGFPGMGRHIAIWKERSDAVGTGTWYGSVLGGGSLITQSGITGSVEN